MSKKYTTPDFDNSDWSIKTKKSEEKPKVMCVKCNLNSWCKFAPWVSGCDEGEIDE